MYSGKFQYFGIWFCGHLEVSISCWKCAWICAHFHAQFIWTHGWNLVHAAFVCMHIPSYHTFLSSVSSPSLSFFLRPRPPPVLSRAFLGFFPLLKHFLKMQNPRQAMRARTTTTMAPTAHMGTREKRTKIKGRLETRHLTHLTNYAWLYFKCVHHKHGRDWYYVWVEWVVWAEVGN